MLRETHRVITRAMDLREEPSVWSDTHVRKVLETMLQTVHRVKYPDEVDDLDVSLRGLSWIVDRYGDGVIIAMEIPSATVVAGPFDIPQDRLTGMVERVIAASAGPTLRIH